MYMEVTAGAISPPDTSATAPHADAAKVLQVDGLQTWFYTRRGIVKAVDNVSFHVRAGATLAIVGESGCGKRIPAMSVLRLNLARTSAGAATSVSVRVGLGG